MGLCTEYMDVMRKSCSVPRSEMITDCGRCALQTNRNVVREQSPAVRDHNIGTSDYAKHTIQPWSIWLEYELNPWDADIVKRVLRKKAGESRRLDYEKIIHVCQERIRQIDNPVI